MLRVFLDHTVFLKQTILVKEPRERFPMAERKVQFLQAAPDTLTAPFLRQLRQRRPGTGYPPTWEAMGLVVVDIDLSPAVAEMCPVGQIIDPRFQCSRVSIYVQCVVSLYARQVADLGDGQRLALLVALGQDRTQRQCRQWPEPLAIYCNP